MKRAVKAHQVETVRKLLKARETALNELRSVTVEQYRSQWVQDLIRDVAYANAGIDGYARLQRLRPDELIELASAPNQRN